MYSIIDVETTGGGVYGQRITDIAIFVHDGERIVREYQSLVDPGVDIPFWITELTGISNETVAGAPKFETIAEEVAELTQDLIFVAHSVNFDYGVIKSEFERLGMPFERKKLCTVKTARHFLPGHDSYSLGNICADFGIAINGRHRAYGDARATVTLFEMIWLEAQKRGLNLLEWSESKHQVILPAKLPRSIYDNLPTEVGVYYLHGLHNEVIYVGSDRHIKDGVTSHFRLKGKKKNLPKELEAITDITYQVTGSKLLAALLELEEVEKLMPQINRQHLKKDKRAALFSYENQRGLKEIGLCPMKSPGKKISVFPSIQAGQTKLDRLIRKFGLCPNHCGIGDSIQICSTCSQMVGNVACQNSSEVEAYNARVSNALKSLTFDDETFCIIEPGRCEEEKTVLLIDEGTYRGYAYVDDHSASDFHSIHNSITHMKEDNLYMRSVVLNYLDENPNTPIFKFES